MFYILYKESFQEQNKLNKMIFCKEIDYSF
jgi:hypothetical protein